MKKEPAGILQIVRRRAVVWLHEVMDPFRVLLGFLPRLRDAIDADDLPISFLLRRGWERAIRSARNESATPSPSIKASNQLLAPHPERRPAARSTLRPTQGHLGAQTGVPRRSRHSTCDDSVH